MTEAIRLQKYFSDCGVLSRRAAEAEILAGHVRVNGCRAVLGDRVIPGTDRVEWNGKPILPRADKPYRYILLNKPRGYVCTAKDEKGRRNVTELTRIAIGSLTLTDLPTGKWRDLTPEEVQYLVQEKD